MRRGLLLFAFLLITIFLSAQNFNAGIRFGLCGSQVNGDRLSGFNKLGVLGGGFVNRKITEKVSLQMEIVFIQKGSRKPTDINNTFYRMRVHYIEVPILFLYHATKKITLTAGPSYGTLIFSEENDEFGVYKNTQPFRKYELAGNAGIIYKLDDQWSFDGRFSQSITTIRPFPGSYNPFFDKGQYNVLVEFSFLREF
jgi:hypothetical protein